MRAIWAAVAFSRKRAEELHVDSKHRP